MKKCFIIVIIMQKKIVIIVIFFTKKNNNGLDSSIVYTIEYSGHFPHFGNKYNQAFYSYTIHVL